MRTVEICQYKNDLQNYAYVIADVLSHVDWMERDVERNVHTGREIAALRNDREVRLQLFGAPVEPLF